MDITSEADGAWAFDVGVELVKAPPAEAEVPGDGDVGEWPAKAAGRHREGHGATVLERGERVLEGAARAVGNQIAVVIREVARSLDHQGHPDGLGLDAVEVTFGVTLTTGLVAVLSVGSTAAVQVRVSLTRQDTVVRGG